MPVTKSAKKALRQSKRRRARNLKRQRLLHETLKKFEKALKAQKKDEARALFNDVQQILDRSAKWQIIKKNTASRKKSRLASRLSRSLPGE